MALVLEIEYLAGIVFAARGPETDQPDWPPQPDRIFSALVATWGARGERADEAEALEWLEQQRVTKIIASSAGPRIAPLSYVPPNDKLADQRNKKFGPPGFRERQPRRFPAAIPDERVVRLYWENGDQDAQRLETLSRLAADTSYVGHSASLTRCRFLNGQSPPSEESFPPTRMVYRGRFEELRARYKQFKESSGKSGRPRPGERVRPELKSAKPAAACCFGTEWTVLEHTGGEMPDIRAAAPMAKEVRAAILSGYSQCGLGDRIPFEVSGHEPDKSPTRQPHLAIVPLSFAGFRYADGHLLGFALVPPHGSALLKSEEFRRAMRKIATVKGERRTLRLHRLGLELSPTREADKLSLEAALYTKRWADFATVTPIVLDRHLKKKGAARQEEIEEQIKAACENAGLPRPANVYPDKHSAVEGAVSAQPSVKSPGWMRWQLPRALDGRFLTHAIIRFSQPVEGPVILGAGRFVGLGLCRPIRLGESEA
jgi:CRISPR-associated protein Csb2